MKDKINAMDCMTVLVGKNASFNHRVLVGHDEDDSEHVIVRHAYVPARDWPEGSVLPAEKGCAAVPQVSHTYAYYWAEYKTDEFGLSNADAFANENGVVITSNSMGASKEDENDFSGLRDGGIVYNLRRVLAERAKTARDGARILMEMVDTWGYASNRAYSIADKDEAFMFQLVRGRHYMGARVPDDAIVVMPNHYNFHTLHDCPEMFYPDDIVSYAIEKGWYTPAKDGDYSDFDFAEAYQLDAAKRQIHNMLRQKHGQRLLLHRDWDFETEGIPFAVYPDRPVTISALAEVFSTHYEGTEDDCEHFGPGRSPHNVPSAQRICTWMLQESALYEFGERPELLTVYTCLGRPCELPYLPLHPLAGMPECMKESVDPCAMMDSHLFPEPGLTGRTDHIRHRFRDLECRLEMVYADEIADMRAILADMLADAERKNAVLIEELRGLYAEGKNGEAALLAASRDEAFLREKLAVLEAYAEKHRFPIRILQPAPIDRAALPEKIVLTLKTKLNVDAGSMIFGVEHTDTRQHYAAAEKDSLQRLSDDSFSIAFPTAPFREQLTGQGVYSFWLGGNELNGRAFAASARITIL